MGFLDEVTITARSGDGGKGCVSFRREKFIPKGGPDGGNGGNGGHIIAQSTRRLYALSYYGSRKIFRAHHGENGKGKNQSGKNGADLILPTPLGTVIEDLETGEILADLTHENQEIILIPGGKGGKGNQHFATSTNRSPRFAQPGLPGVEKKLRLSLKLIADIGLIGLPNAGKSTLLSRLSSAAPKVDSYPFTTVFPNLGVTNLDDETFLVIADIPGLIEGASRGRGLGHRFLKHIERTKILLHLLDITFEPENDILDDYHTIRNEMTAYDPGLAEKPHMVLINKMDLYGGNHRDPEKMRKALEGEGVDSLPISALTGDGLDRLKRIIVQKWKSL